MTRGWPRKFWEYEDIDGQITNFRVKWFIGSILVAASIAAVLAFIGGMDIWWPTIPGGALIGASGTSIAFAIDYVSDNRRFRSG